MLKQFAWTVGLMLFLPALGLFAQADRPAMAAVSADRLMIYGSGGPVEVMTIDQGRYIDLTWSPDGSTLAFVVNDGAARVLRTSRGGEAPVEVANDVALLPVTFSGDSGALIYTAEAGPAEGGEGLPRVTLAVYERALAPDAPANQIGTFPFGTGCGGGSPFPMDAVYNLEAGFGGTRLMLHQTPHGLLHSTNCTGGEIALLDPGSGENRVLASGIAATSLAPDRSRLAVVRGAQLEVIALDSGDVVQSVALQAAPDQIAWGGGDTLYTSTRALRDAPLPLSEAETSALSALFGLNDVPQYDVGLWRVTLGGEQTRLYSGPGWAIGRILPSTQGLYFSLIPNGEAWVEAVTSGELDLTTEAGVRQERQTVAVRLLRLDGEAVEIDPDLSRAVLHPESRPS